MRWKLKPVSKPGYRRVRSKFLLFPKEIDREIRWLEWAEFIQVRGKHGWYDHSWWVEGAENL